MTPLATELAAAKRGGTYSLRYADVDTIATFNFDASNWAEGLSENVSFSELVIPDGDAGSWTGSVLLEPLTDVSRGIHIEWVGEDVVLSYSTDNSNWIPLVNRRTILEDVNTTGLSVFIRAELQNADAWLQSIRLDLMGERIMVPISLTRPLSFKGAHMDHESEHQLDFVDDSGATIIDGYIQIDTDAGDTPGAARTVDFWARFDDEVGYLVRYDATHYVRLETGSNMVISGVTVYRNGVLVTNNTPVAQDTWAHYVVVFHANQTGPIKFGNNVANDNPLNMNIGHLAYYDYAFTAAQALRLYNLNIGNAKIVVTDPGKIKVTEATPTVDVYAYSWSLVQGT